MKYHDLIQIICTEWKMGDMNEMEGETGKSAFSKELLHTKSWTISLLDTTIKLREKWEGWAATRDKQMNGREK